MKKKTIISALSSALVLAILSGCSGKSAVPPSPSASEPASSARVSPAASAAIGTPGESGTPAGSGAPASSGTTPAAAQTPAPSAGQVAPKASAAAPNRTPSAAPTVKPDRSAPDNLVAAAAEPASLTVLVNKQFALPNRFAPADLVYPDVPFLFKEKIDKRKMRKEAAQALERLFAGASKGGVSLAGVSAYRSNATQKALFDSYVKKDGEAKARTYSAVPGTSEHETGLAIDLSGSSGTCAAQSCFAGTKEAVWLAKHAPEYGFIIRYPQGKESITGYQYEPWHIRYVGMKVAGEIAKRGITLEEYFNAVPVSR